MINTERSAFSTVFYVKIGKCVFLKKKKIWEFDHDSKNNDSRDCKLICNMYVWKMLNPYRVITFGVLTKIW